jgi:hypothetical protein
VLEKQDITMEWANTHLFNELALLFAGLTKHANVLDEWRVVEL